MIRLRALGQCAFEIGKRRLTPESSVLFTVLFVVASRIGRPVSRAHLVDLIWPDCNSDSGRHRLRQAVYQLNRMEAQIETTESEIWLTAHSVEFDYVSICADRAMLGEALKVANCFDCLPGYRPSFSSEVARWVEAERDRILSSLRSSLTDQLNRSVVRSDHAGVIVFARACLELDPLNSDAAIAIATSLVGTGQAHEALSIVDRVHSNRVDAGLGSSTTFTEFRKRVRASIQQYGASSSPNEYLYGRDDTIAELEYWIRGGASRSYSLALVGEPGIGKSRLLAEVRRMAAVHDVRTIDARASSNGASKPLAGLIDLLPAMIDLPGAVGCAPLAYTRLIELAKGTVSTESLPVDGSDSVFRFAALRRSVFDLVDAICSECSVLICLDDAHALDRPTLELLVDASQRSAGALRLILALRPYAVSTDFIGKLTNLKLLRISKLQLAASRTLIDSQLDEDQASIRAEVVNWILEIADGNPFFLVELASHVRRGADPEALPASLQAVLERKLNTLSPTAQLVVQACALLAHNSSLPRLEFMLGLAPHSLASALSELESSGLVTARAGWIGCRHDLITEAVTRNMGVSIAQYLHRRCAVLLDEEAQAAPAAPLAWDCASHWSAANEPTRALELTWTIVDQLLLLGLPRSAVDMCKLSLGYCQSVEQRAEHLLRQGRAERLAFDWNAVRASLEARRTLLKSVGRRVERYSEADVLLEEADYWRDTTGRLSGRALRRLSDHRAPLLYRLQMAVLGLIAADNQHRRDDATAIFEHVRHITPGNAQERIESLKAGLIYHTAFGDLATAKSCGEQIVDIERRAGNSSGLLRGLRWLANPLRYLNDLSGALSAVEEAYDRASRLGLRAEMWNATYARVSIAVDAEISNVAWHWVPTLEDLSNDATVRAFGPSVHKYLLARLEFERGDLHAAKVYLDGSRELQTLLPSVRGEHLLLALEVFISLREGKRTVSHAAIARLRALQIRTLDCCARDFEAAALIAAVNSRGDKTTARNILSEFLERRRAETPLHAELRRMQRELALDAG